MSTLKPRHSTRWNSALRRRIALPLLFAAAIAPAAYAQTSTGSEEPPAAALGEEVNVNLLQIPILALDRRERPITDLRMDELRVKVAGRKVPVGLLEPFIETAKEEAPLPFVRLRVDLPGGGESLIASNNEEIRHILFFIDVENDQPLGKSRAAGQAIRFLMEDLDPSYRVAVLSYNGTVNIEQSFTADRQLAADAIRAAFDRDPRPNIDMTLRIRQLLDRIDDCVIRRRDFVSSASGNCMEAVALEYADEVRPRSKDFLIALEGVVNFAAGLSGRKSVLAISHGVASSPRDELVEAFKAKLGDTMELNQVILAISNGEGTGIQVDKLLDYAIQREVTLSFIDRTLQPPGVLSARNGEQYTPGSRPIEVAYREPQADSQILARTTGGIFVHTQDLGEGLKKAVDAERGAYSVGIYLDYYLPKDRLSKISVSTTRPGVRIHHQRGTYAASMRPGARELFRGNIALGSPLRVPTDANRLKIPFRIEAEARDLGYNRSEDYALANFTVHVEVEAEDGRVAADSYHLVSHAYPWDLWAEGDVEPVQIDGWVELPLGSYRLVAHFSNPRQDITGDLERQINVASQAPPQESPE